MKDTKDVMSTIAQNMRIYRKAKKMTINQLSEISGISPSNLSKIENNHSVNTSVITIMNIAQALDTDWEHMVNPFKASEYDIPNSKAQLDEDEISNAIYKSEIRKTYYPPIRQNHTISSMAELILILPLINVINLYDALLRISGDVIEYEDYISTLFDGIWEGVPETSAKKFIENEISKIKLMREGKTPSDDVEFFSQFDEKGFDEYRELLKKQYFHVTTYYSLINDNPFFTKSKKKTCK